MKKKPEAKFSVTRIKRIMQTDEDVGKIAQAVPYLVSRALELFLQDLCVKTSEITAGKGAKTMSVAHLQAVVTSNPLYDFLEETVSRAREETDGEGRHTAEDEGRPPLGKRSSAEMASALDERESSQSQKQQKQPKPEALEGLHRGDVKVKVEELRQGASREEDPLKEPMKVKEEVERQLPSLDAADSRSLRNKQLGAEKEQAGAEKEQKPLIPTPRDFDLNIDLQSDTGLEFQMTGDGGNTGLEVKLRSLAGTGQAAPDVEEDDYDCE